MEFLVFTLKRSCLQQGWLVWNGIHVPDEKERGGEGGSGPSSSVLHREPELGCDYQGLQVLLHKSEGNTITPYSSLIVSIRL